MITVSAHPKVEHLEIAALYVQALEQWNNGTMEQWNNGTMEQWNNGTMEKWKNGKMVGHYPRNSGVKGSGKIIANSAIRLCTKSIYIYQMIHRGHRDWQ
nr:hypothetical protein [Yersinia enterocolitica]